MKEQKLKSTIAYQGNFLTVFKDEVKAANGHLTTREYIKHPGAAMVIPILANGNVLAIRQYRYACDKIFIEFPAGRIDAGETPEQAAIRELEEEVGLKAKSVTKLTSIAPAIGYADEIIHLYIAENLVPTKTNMDVDEAIEPFELSLVELSKLIWSGQIPDPKTQIAGLWLLKQRGLC